MAGKIEISRRKAVTLLAYLAVSNQTHCHDALSTMFWPEAGQARARAALRSALWTLNETPIKDWLLVDPETVSLVFMGGSEQTLISDIDRFRDLLAVAQSHDYTPIESCADCLAALAQAAILYQNDFMAGLMLLRPSVYLLLFTLNLETALGVYLTQQQIKSTPSLRGRLWQKSVAFMMSASGLSA